MAFILTKWVGTHQGLHEHCGHVLHHVIPTGRLMNRCCLVFSWNLLSHQFGRFPQRNQWQYMHIGLRHMVGRTLPRICLLVVGLWQVRWHGWILKHTIEASTLVTSHCSKSKLEVLDHLESHRSIWKLAIGCEDASHCWSCTLLRQRCHPKSPEPLSHLCQFHMVPCRSALESAPIIFCEIAANFNALWLAYCCMFGSWLVLHKLLINATFDLIFDGSAQLWAIQGIEELQSISWCQVYKCQFGCDCTCQFGFNGSKTWLFLPGNQQSCNIVDLLGARQTLKNVFINQQWWQNMLAKSLQLYHWLST